MKDYLLKTFKDILNEMEQIPQDSEWHAKGNVKIHTIMVLEELFKDIEYKSLPEDKKEILAYAAFFHDLGKIYTTKEENGRIISPNHSKVGAQEFRTIFFDIMPFEKRENIVNLIRYHGYPIHYYEKPEFKIVEIASILDTQLLYLLTKADINGRISSGKEEYLLNIDYFKEKAIEYNCYGRSLKFSSAAARNHFFKTGVKYEPLIEKRSTVTMLVGLPGVGKDFYIKEHKLKNVISLDQLRIDMKVKRGNKKQEGQMLQKAKFKIKRYLADNQDFVFNATNLIKSNRTKWVSLFKEYGATVNIVYLEKSLTKIFIQNRNRKDSVPDWTISDYLRNLEIPTIEEADSIEYIIEERKNNFIC